MQRSKKSHACRLEIGDPADWKICVTAQAHLICGRGPGMLQPDANCPYLVPPTRDFRFNTY